MGKVERVKTRPRLQSPDNCTAPCDDVFISGKLGWSRLLILVPVYDTFVCSSNSLTKTARGSFC